MPHVIERQRLLEDLDRVGRRLVLSVNQFPHRTQRLREQLNNVHRLYATLSVHRYVQNRIQIRSSIDKVNRFFIKMRRSAISRQH